MSRKIAERALLRMLTEEGNAGFSALLGLDAASMAGLYVSNAFLRTALGFLGEQFWLRSQKVGAFTYPDFLSPFLAAELEPIAFLKELFTPETVPRAKALTAKATALESLLLESMIERPYAEQKEFARAALGQMATLFAFETSLQASNADRGTHLGLSLYRTFDGLDQLFGLNYALDKNVKQELHETERLYEGAGVGVQSGCSTVLTALRHLELKPGARFIDLGSGYGRVGLLVGLLHPEVLFTGYEFVKERVGLGNQAAENLGMLSHVRFLTQDLSSADFQIPEAEVYYLYDPFSESTYAHVLAQLCAIARRKKITIVTKGNASRWLTRMAEAEGWPAAREFDSGNLRFYGTR